MSVRHNGQVLTDAGALTVVAGTPSGAMYRSGWAYDATSGQAFIVEQGASAVPATAKFVAGRAFTQAGELYTTTDAPDSTTVTIGGTAVRGDGAVHVSYSDPAATDVKVAGIAHTQTGVMRASI